MFTINLEHFNMNQVIRSWLMLGPDQMMHKIRISYFISCVYMAVEWSRRQGRWHSSKTGQASCQTQKRE